VPFCGQGCPQLPFFEQHVTRSSGTFSPIASRGQIGFTSPMRHLLHLFAPACFSAFLLCGPHALPAAETIGIFEGHADVGGPKRGGSAQFSSPQHAYSIAGGGKNMWFTNDALHFVWKKISGDVSLAADITFQGQGTDPHRKACLLIRQNLETDSAYADAALHGDGLTSLQYREANGAMTREIQSNISGPRRLRIEKRGKYVSMSVARAGEALQPAGGSFRLELQEPFYVGLGVCAHNDDALETAVFSNVELTAGAPAAMKPGLISTLETITISSKDRRVVWWTTNLIEAPNWSRDGAALYFNSKGRIFRVAPTGGEPQPIDTGFAIRCNNDHGISPDGTQLVISDQSQGNRRSLIYTLPMGGGAPKLITETGPSYWHGWSPDGRTLAYCAERNGEFDIYTISTNGGAETRLTTAEGLDDGPDYSPDGKSIYFNSDRTGRMQVWRMAADGKQQEQVTSDEWNNWFPHPSPDGKSLVFLSYEPDVKGHPENKDVMLRLLTLATGKIEVLAKLFGGQGTINVPSWSPDSRKLSFVSYQRSAP
jgi:Tol biopolymer transport system component